MKKSLTSANLIATYFILTFIISWGAILIILGKSAIPATPENQQQIGSVILLGPTLAGIIVILLTQRWKGLKNLGVRLLHWKTSIQWYALAILTAPVSTILGWAIFRLFYPDTLPAIWDVQDVFPLLSLGLIGGIFIAFFEELGWSGYATPTLLQKKSIFQTGLFIGLVWGTWHFILFWEEDSFSQSIAFWLLLVRLFAWLPAYRILMVWIYKRSDSLLVVMLMHTALVASLAILDPVISGSALIFYILIRASILWLLVLLVYMFDLKKI